MKKVVIWLTMLLIISSTGLALAAGQRNCVCKNKNDWSCEKVDNKEMRNTKNILFEVDSVELSEDGQYITVFSTKQDLFATITPEVCKEFKEIKAGTRLKLWYEIMTMSLPARTNAVKVKILKK